MHCCRPVLTSPGFCAGSGHAHLRSVSVPGGGARSAGARRQRSQARAVLNWRRARLAVTRKITTDMLGVQRRCALVPFTLSLTQSSAQVMARAAGRHVQDHLGVQRRCAPVCLDISQALVVGSKVEGVQVLIAA